MRDIRTSKVFVSVQRAEKSEEVNHKNHVRTFEMLRTMGLSFSIVRGMYQGRIEDTFMLYTTDASEHQRHLELSIEVARSYGQDAILEVANDDSAIVHHLSTGYQTVRVGTFREASKAEALTRSAYTCEPLSGRYFVLD